MWRFRQPSIRTLVVIKNHLLLLEIVVGLFAGVGHLIAQVTPPVSLAWDASPSPDVTGYIVRHGTASGVYSSATNVGNQTSASVTGLQAGQTYYLVVTARNAAGVESLPSNEATYQAATNLPVSESSPRSLPIARSRRERMECSSRRIRIPRRR